MKTTTQDILTVIERKHTLAKDLAQFREGLSRNQDKRKFDYATYLYALKGKHTDKVFEQSMSRLKYLHDVVRASPRTRSSKKK